MSPIFVLCVVALGLVLWATRFHKQRYIPGVPIVGGPGKIRENRKLFVTEGMAILRRGYEENKDRLFYVPTPIGERLILPSRYLEELKAADMRQVDFQATFLEMFEGSYTTLGTHSRLLPQVVRAQLNQHLGEEIKPLRQTTDTANPPLTPANVLPQIQAEIRESLTEVLPPCEDWTEINVTDVMAVIIARVSSRMFGGTRLSRNEGWIQASLRFAHDGFQAATKLKKWPGLLKPIGQYFVPEITSIRNTYRVAENAIVPLLEERDRGCQKKDAHDLVGWMYAQAEGAEKSKKFIAGTLLKVSFAAYHTSAAAPTQLLFDLAARPEYIPALREEFYAADRDAVGNVSVKGFASMMKMDSIMKESQRFNPLLLLTFERIIKQDFRLSDGTVIPANTWVGSPAQAIAMDADLYPNPDTFDGFRFAKSTTTGAHEAGRRMPAIVKGKPHYTSAHPGSMAFGYGQHACPGRFFAMMEIKAITGEILKRYELKLPGGARPASVTFETQHLPNPDGRVLFRARRESQVI
ncbi:cytochrome P450 [Aspergillus melleus]|uniref:cytochrome P450 n=1 Tax=Aspergillus melleus TaxID=138277 RepID=UPI001E8D3269|nr:uncharacterized protein LDX57_009720 [Aspergillus melleus]KAH8432073.1 hypothetical protein LDX57_009720 [Aspergillus melleus]